MNLKRLLWMPFINPNSPRGLIIRAEKLESFYYSVERLTEELKHEECTVERTRKRIEALNKKIRELQSSEQKVET